MPIIVIVKVICVIDVEMENKRTTPEATAGTYP